MRRYMIGIFLTVVFMLVSGFVSSVSSMIFARYLCSFKINDTNLVFNTLEKFNLKNKLKNKYQKVSGPCWAFASIATLEATLAKKNMLEKPLSEKDLLNWANRRENESGWHIKLQDGGKFNISEGYFTSGEGPIFESSCVYNINDCNYSGPTSFPGYSVKGIKMVDNNIDSIKKAISEYGAVAVAYKSDLNIDTFHAVCIVGWDDGKKSWLAKDSGSSSFQYKWLSYDKDLKDIFAITSVKNSDPNEKIYQYDKFGINAYFSRNNVLKCANVYSFDNDILNSVMIYSTSEDSKCDVFVADVDSNGNINVDQSTWTCVKSNAIIPYKGYFEIPTKSIRLSGKKAIIIKIKSSKGKKSEIGVLMSSREDGIRINDDDKSNIESYIFSSEKFVPASELIKDMCACSIKAITRK